LLFSFLDDYFLSSALQGLTRRIFLMMCKETSLTISVFVSNINILLVPQQAIGISPVI